VNLPSLPVLAWIVARDVNRTVGGGLAAMELLRRTSLARGWLDDGGNALLVAASRLTPGTNVLAYCVGLGWRLRGAPGAAWALLAASVPGSLVIVLITATLVRVDRFVIVRALLAAGTLVAAAVVLWSAWPLLRPHATGPARTRAVIVMLVASALLLLDVTPVQTLLAAAVVGALTARRVRLRPATPDGRP
jgi:chromate transporter